MPSDKRQRKRENAQLRHQQIAEERRRADVRRRVVTGLVVLALFAGAVFLITTLQGDDDEDVTTATTSPTDTTEATEPEPAGDPAECPQPDGSSPQTREFAAPFETCIDPAKAYRATMETDVGSVVIELDAGKAPKTVNNFVSLARYHYFDDLTFHRVIPGFVVQGGDPKGDGTGGPGYEFEDELPEQGEYEIGSLAMANSGPDTNGSQFFIITGDDGAQLPPNYSLFGKVVEGMDVVKKIEADGDPSGTPKVLHRMVKVTIEEA